MNARTKLNGSYVNGALIFAAIVGYLTGSWLVFLVVLILETAVALHSGDIRPSGNQSRSSTRGRSGPSRGSR